MAEVTYALVVVPAAHRDNFSLATNEFYGEPVGTPNLLGRLVAAGTAGAPPITHYFGGLYVDAAWTAVFQNTATPPVPTGGWPLTDPEDAEVVLLTEEDAQAAWSARQIMTRTGQQSSILTAQTREAMYSALNLMLFDPGE